MNRTSELSMQHQITE